MLAQQTPAKRELKIKTGVLKRLIKELDAYEKEAVKQQARIDKLLENGADEHDVKKQKEVLDETTQMLPDSKRRMQAAREELVKLVAVFKDNVEDEDVKAANELLQSA